MMWMFTSFDALCAEYVLNKKVGFSVSNQQLSSSYIKNNSSESRPKDQENSQLLKDKKPQNQQQQQQKKTLRFAPELDGLNCFETIILS
ncbi:hypothetical protein FRX31_003808 [Thalictrum thalictroides]|uniref:Uncharacterized protein n=1 Tax=Thalictrum thalictroides TaxID=46969 RepID=A0A7J6XA37_THATH|nr:hypothetical protein FRX31_003808 [Thalictrum thalictroides]